MKWTEWSQYDNVYIHLAIQCCLQWVVAAFFWKSFPQHISIWFSHREVQIISTCHNWLNQNSAKISRHDLNLISSDSDQNTPAWQIVKRTSHLFHKMQVSPNLIHLASENGAVGKINIPWPKFNQFWRWSEHISMSNYNHSSPIP